MSRTPNLYLGLDLGTSGARGVVLSDRGERVVWAGRAYGGPVGEPLPPDRHEQDPGAWWEAACAVLGDVAGQLARRDVSPERVAALSVDGTSGTLVCVDRDGEPLGAALMYNDARADEEAALLQPVLSDVAGKLGYRIAAGFTLAKALWVLRREPARFERTRWLLPQAAFVAGRLAGRLGWSDQSNVLKFGYDLLAERWPDGLERWPGLEERLPQVVASGDRIGSLEPRLARRLGLSERTAVVAGVSDGTAGFLASGARRPGDTNTSLGTTLVVKRLSDRPCTDPTGRVYCHKLPGGRWLPGAASNTGAEWVGREAGAADPAGLDRAAADRLPSDLIAYPLVRRGERFPFRAAGAEGFCTPSPPDGAAAHAARLQGLALLERLGYETLDRICGEGSVDVYCSGAASRSDVWTQLRADVTGRSLHRPAHPETACGSAVLAASLAFGDPADAAAAMVRLERTFHPRAPLQSIYEQRYTRFLRLLRDRGYLEGAAL